MSSVRIMLVGDNVAIDHPKTLRYFYENVRPTLKQCDILFGNLEWPMTDGEGHDATRFSRPRGHMRPSDIEAFAEAGFNVVSLANNHIMDWGEHGLRQTIGLLDANGIAHCGAGTTSGEARVPAILTRKDMRIAFLAYTAVFLLPEHGSAHWNGDCPMATLKVETFYIPSHRVFEEPGAPPEVRTKADPASLGRVLEDIRTARTSADAVIVSWHWGNSRGVRRRTDYQMEVGRASIDAGATVVVGHHPHTLQGLEVYNGGLIAYSLANFVFWRGTDPGPNHDLFTAILDCDLEGPVLRAARLIPIDLSRGREPRTDGEGPVCVQVLEALRKDSQDFSTRFTEHAGVINVGL